MSHMSRLRRATLVATVAFAAAGFAWAVYYAGGGLRQNAAEAAFRNGLFLYSQYQYDAASEQFLLSLGKNNDFHLARRMLGQSLLFSGKQDEALHEWRLLLDSGQYDPSLALHIQTLENLAPQRDNKWVFSRIIEQKRGYKYSLPTFVGNLPSRNIFFLSLGLLDTGSLLEVSADEGFRKVLRRISGRLKAPIGAATGSREIWISDFETDQVHRLNHSLTTGLPYLQDTPAIGGKGSAEGQFHGPAGIAFCDNAFWIADHGNNRVQKFDEDGNFILAFSDVDGGWKLNHPFGIACSDKGGLWVSEPEEARISEFDRYGNFVRYRFETILKKPRHLFHDSENGYLMIADEARGIHIFDLRSNEHKLLEGYNRADGQFIRFNRPYSATLDYFGNLFVADYAAHSIIQFVPESRLMTNLDVYIENIISHQYPAVHLIASVKDEKGRPLTELSSENFSVFENDAYTGNLRADTLSKFQNQLHYRIILSRSKQMADYFDSLPHTLDIMLSDLREKDTVQLISYTNSYRDDTPATNSRLRILQGAREKLETDYTSDIVSGYSKALYHAISQLLPYFGRRAIVWITDGSLSGDGTDGFPLDRIENYAKINHIQIYVISYENPRLFDFRENRERLAELARRTGGEYYNAFGDLRRLPMRMRQPREERYMLSYRSGGDSSWVGQYMEVRLTAVFQGRRGAETGGYFIPGK